MSGKAELSVKSHKRGLNKPGWWIVFLVATFSLSLFFRTFKAFTLAPDGVHALPWLLSILLLISSFLTLLYDCYIKEKGKGTVLHPFPLFEWLYVRQYPTENGGSDLP